MITELVVIAVLILLSAFFSAAEIALFSISEARLVSLSEKKFHGANTALKLKRSHHRLLTVVLISNNLVNIGASALATVLSISYYGSLGPGIATGVMTLLLLTFGEIIPKSIAVAHNEKISLFAAYPLYLLSILLFPLVYIFENLSKFVIYLIGDEGSSSVDSEELRAMVSIGAEEGTITKHEKSMIHNVLRLNDKDVYQVMTPRNEVFVIEMNKRISDVVDLIVEKGYSRIPVYDKKVANVKGVVYIKDVLRQLQEKKNSYLKDIMTKPIIVPELKKVNSLLEEFKQRKSHLAIVVDEHGDFSGIVTIEDALEEIVGEIYDETDKEEYKIKKISNRAFIISGKANLDEVFEKAKISMKGPRKGDFETVNGLIQFKTGRIPHEGEKIIFRKFTIEVLERDDNKVILAKLVKKTR